MIIKSKTWKPEEYIHIEVCKKAISDENTFNNFKKMPNFVDVLEHTTEKWGRCYMQLIFNNFVNVINVIDWNKIKENDKYGNASKCDFSELKKYVKLDNYNISPSTIAYTYKGLCILDFLLNKKINNVKILEIGGGYGGQCKILYDLSEIFNIKIEQYGIIDLSVVLKLQNKYLSLLGYNGVFFYEYEELKNFNDFNEYNVLISIYALGEFDVNIQNFYIENILKNINTYYIIWNTAPVNDYFSGCKITDEVPKTGAYNKLILK